MIEALQYTFMQNALAAGLLASLACGVIGSLVVVNRLVFLAGGVAHAAYGGVGLAFYFSWPVLPSTIGFTLAASGVMGWATLKHKNRSDTLVGVLWAAGMACGILLLDLAPGYNVDLMSYLFGSILTAPRSDILIMLGLDLLILATVFMYYKDLVAMSFDPEFARTCGVPVRGLHFLLLGLTAVSVVLIIQVVGLILVIALLTIPPSMAGRTCRTLAGMMLQASAWSALFCLAGLYLSYAFDLTSGATIIGVATVGFFLHTGALRLWKLLGKAEVLEI
jgi:zinc transport system permease protein